VASVLAVIFSALGYLFMGFFLAIGFAMGRGVVSRFSLWREERNPQIREIFSSVSE